MWYDYMQNKKEITRKTQEKVGKLPEEFKNLKIYNLFTNPEDSDYCSLSFFIPTEKEDYGYQFNDIFIIKVSLNMQEIKYQTIKKINTTNLDRIDIDISICEDYKYDYGTEYKKVKVKGALELEIICKTIIFSI